jgi:HTH-type transcriptional regulator, glycine betaine synthesis regulator
MNERTKEQFVESWGSMGMLWGINRSMARIHALLIATEEPVTLDDICKELQISRGNASMSLKELRSWRVIQRVHVPGDRRDFYVTEQDVWSMFFRIIDERKRREFDPAISAVRQALDSTEAVDSKVGARLEQMGELLDIMDKVMSHTLGDERRSHTLLQLVTKMLGLEGPK